MKHSGKTRIMHDILFPYGFVFLSSLLIVLCVLQIWRGDIHVPFLYDKDALFYSQCAKSMIDNGWYLFNGFTGMPEGGVLYDYPQGENLFFLMMKILTLLTNDFAATINIFYIITFPLTAMVSYYVLKKLNVPSALSWMGSIIYGFLPYHFIRGINHIGLSAYFLVPLSILLSLWIMEGELSFTSRDAAEQVRGQNRRRFAFGAVVCILVASAGIYYAYFTCLFLLLAGLVSAIWRRKPAPVVTAVALVMIIVISGIINISPAFIFRIGHGPNRHAIERVYHETELYGLKMTSLLLPVEDHRIQLLGDLKKQYVRESSYLYRFTENESRSASLGLFGSAGFIFMILILIAVRRDDKIPGTHGNDINRLYHMSVLNIFAFLTATVGGLASFFAPFVRYKIRAYNRISVFIGFLAIATMVIIMKLLYETFLKDRLAFKLPMRGRALIVPVSTLLLYGCAAAVAGMAVFDQVGTGAVPDYRATASVFDADKRFIGEVEKMMPRNAMIFQLPYIEYLGNRPLPGTMSGYEHFKCYLHSKQLRWSFGAVVGRDTDDWQKQVSALPARELLKEIEAKGFTGVCINRDGYTDKGESLIREMKALLNSEPLTQKNGRLVFFKLASR